VAVLVSTLAGASSLAILVLWPLVADSELPSTTAWILGGVVAVAALLLVVEWRLVH
jgi:hypothetical protein